MGIDYRVSQTHNQTATENDSLALAPRLSNGTSIVV